MVRRAAVIALLVAGWSLTSSAAVSVNLTIQEALYSGGTSGVARSDEPVTVGIPLPDSAADGVGDTSTLGLTGASVGQFRELGAWSSGRVKWVLVDTQLGSVSAGASSTAITLTNAGSGNFGGSDLATDNGSTISIATGACTFTIREANFNGFHQVVCGSTTIVASGASTGLVVVGPANPNTSCGTCTTVFSSANDAGSTTTIEENGPVRAAIKSTGDLEDGSGNVYMHYTVRMHFYKSKGYVRTTVTLRNADFGASSSFATAYKGFDAFEWRLTPTLSGTANYQVGKDAGAVESGTLTAGTGDIELYSAQSEWMEHNDWGCCGAVDYTPDTGWRVTKDGSNLDTGSTTEYVAGWADIRGATDGAGVSIGVYQLPGYWPKSLEFNDAGTDTRIGIWPRQSSAGYYQAWPQWSTHDLYFHFHASALSSPGDEFLKFQHPLIARASRSHYNLTAVFPYPIVDPAVEDQFYDDTHATRNPASGNAFSDVVNAAPANGNISGGHALKLAVVRAFSWGSGGESRQQEFRYGWLLTWLGRGFTGHYLAARQFYRFQTDDGSPHSDGFTWTSSTFPNIDLHGRPNATSSNSSNAFRQWYDQDHPHWYGMGFYYLMSGDELVKEAILDGYLDWHTHDGVAQSGLVHSGTEDGLFTARGAAMLLTGASWLVDFLTTIGESGSASTVLTRATALFDTDIKTTLCTNAEQTPQSCTSGTASDSRTDEGISRTRGMFSSGGGTQNYCGVSHLPIGQRISSSWSQGAFGAQALLEFSKQKGSGWTDYWLARDLAVGLYQGHLDEAWVEIGNNRWDQDHWRAAIAFDIVGACTPPPDYDDYWLPNVSITSHWMLFWSQYELRGLADWTAILRKNMLKVINYNGPAAPDFYGYQVGAAIHAAMTTPIITLQNVTITSFVDNGGGSYTIGWTVPSGASIYRIKWGNKQIVEWIGFAPETNTFVGNPTTTMNWFAATNVTPPSPGTPGTTQNTTISTGAAGLTSSNFSVKAIVDLSVASRPVRLRLRPPDEAFQ